MLLALGALVIIAALLRVVDLERIPPGLYHDEAVNGLDVWNVLLGQRAPIFFEANGGREPLFLYVQTISVGIFGPSIWSLRVVSALLGVLTLIAFYKFARALELPNIDASQLALVACAGLAVSYWHLHWSRVGLRAISLPLVLCLSFYFFWRARRAHQTFLYALAGLFLGLSFYTYLAARLAPLIYLLFIFADWRTTRAQWRNCLVLFGTALLVAAPLGIYFLQNPAAFSTRTSDIALAGATFGEFVQALALNIARVGGMFFVTGDLEWRHGIAARPVLDPLAAILFGIGLLAALKFWREPAARFAWIVLGVMLAPTIFSQAAPDALRAIGALSIVFWFAALGWMQLRAWLMPRLQLSSARWTLVGVAIFLIGSGFFTVRDYFGTWANDRRAYRDFDGEFTEIARWLNAQTENVLVPLDVYAYPTVQFLTLARAPNLLPAQNDLNTESVLVLPAADAARAQQYVLVENRRARVLEPRALPNLPTATTLQGRYRALSSILRAQNIAALVSHNASRVTLNAQYDGITLRGYSLASKRLEPNTPPEILLDWERTGNVAPELAVFLNLLDAQGNVIARATQPLTQGVSAARYPLHATIPDAHRLEIPDALEPGKYALEFGLFDLIQQERLDANIEGGLRDQFMIAVGVPFARVEVPNTAIQTDARWENGILLRAYQTDADQLRAGEMSEWTFYWTTTQPIQNDVTVFIQLTDAQGEIVAQADHDPMQGAYPTSLWQPKEIVADTFSLTLPPNLATGTYTLKLGWYERATNERVKIASPRAEDDALKIQIQFDSLEN